MIEATQLERLAAMGNALRPDWPRNSLYTHLVKHYAHRSYRDVAVALAYVAADPATTTPARLNENGPWWSATRDQQNSGPSIPRGRCDECGGLHDPADEHTPVADDRLDGGDGRIEALRDALAEAQQRLCSHGVQPENCNEPHDNSLQSSPMDDPWQTEAEGDPDEPF